MFEIDEAVPGLGHGKGTEHSAAVLAVPCVVTVHGDGME